MNADHRWQGYSHEELYRQLHSGPGPAASAASIRRWSEMSKALDEIDKDIKEALARGGAAWEGRASDAAQGKLSPLVQWARDAKTGAEVMRLSAEQQAEHIGKARADMPRPVKVSAEQPNALVAGLVHLFGGQTDYEVQEAARSTAERQAVEVMSAYQAKTTSNTSTLGQFTQPPQLSVEPLNPRVDGAPVPGHGRPVTRPRGGSLPTQRTPVNRGTTSQPTRPSTSAPAAKQITPGPRAVTPTATHVSPPPAVRPAAALPGVPSLSPAPPSAPSGMVTQASAVSLPAPQTSPPSSYSVIGVEQVQSGTALAGVSARREEDREHRGADYLVETDDIFGDSFLVAPPVIGES
ncbi:PPE domain-containing protein [Allokutzneria albata]|uniref:PPE family protein n=1 Tax=Allokutzneria albata TaxID=211114 RepID=A0A1H0BAE4_ALLAB|nr:PPE domain-containing protein [Allokutzneria albata]SDN42608.1 PPE family protein [Allokutzneria albata]